MSTIERPVEREVEVLTEREHRARTLEAAALEIEVRGWTQFCRLRPEGTVCAVGAVQFALGDSVDSFSGDFAYGRAAQIFGTGIRGLDSFNDRRAKSAADVTFLLRWRAEEIRDGR